MASPAIVTVSKFTTSQTKKFSNYIKYIGRNEATRTEKFKEYNLNKLDGYNHYMGNPEKSSGLFTKYKNDLNKSDLKTLKNQFQKAQTNDSVMWQDVISFDNKWLEQMGLYEKQSKWLNEDLIKQTVREGMEVMMKDEGLENSGIWSAAIHYNTKNIHVHIAIVEPEPTREYGEYKDKKTGEMYRARRGYRSYPSINRFKSNVANKLANRDKELSKLTNLIRKQLGTKNEDFKQLPDLELKKMYRQIENKLPDDKRLWKYNMNALADIKPNIDKFITRYLDVYEKSNMEEFNKQIESEIQFRKALYGDGDKEKGRAEDLRDTKYAELYSKLGNSLLKEMIADSKMQKESFQKTEFKTTEFKQSNYSKPVDLNKIKKAFSKDFESIKNQRKYKQTMEEENGMQR